MTASAYKPMHPPQKHVTTEDMWKTLAKHSPIPPQTPQAVATPKAELPALVWEKPVKTGEMAGYVLSADGAFSVDKTPVMGVPMYTAWKCKWGTRVDKDGNVHPKRELPEANLGVRLTLLEAQHLCELAR